MQRKTALSGQLRVNLIGALLEFMARSGVSEGDIRETVDQVLRGASQPRSKNGVLRQDGRYIGNGNVSAELLRVWHKDAKYLDDDAKPRALWLARGKCSLRSLVKELDPDVDALDVLRGMRVVGLLRRTREGKFVPTSESVTIGQLHPLAVEHVAKSVVRLVSTVCRNTDPDGHSLPLVERYAYVPDLNRSDMAEFAAFTRSQGMAYLEAVDDWLEQRRAKRTCLPSGQRGESVAAGVHLIAYLGDSTEPSNAKGSVVGRRSPSKGKNSAGAASNAMGLVVSPPEAHA